MLLFLRRTLLVIALTIQRLTNVPAQVRYRPFLKVRPIQPVTKTVQVRRLHAKVAAKTATASRFVQVLAVIFKCYRINLVDPADGAAARPGDEFAQVTFVTPDLPVGTTFPIQMTQVA